MIVSSQEMEGELQFPLMPDADGTGADTLLESDACSHLLKVCNLTVPM